MPGARLDGPPSSPPEVTGPMGMMTQQFGQQLMNKRNGGGPPPDLQGANPQGFLKTQFDAVEKVVQQMAASSRQLAPYAMRALATLKEGVSMAMASPPEAAGGDQASARPEVQSPAVGASAEEGAAGSSGGGGGFVG